MINGRACVLLVDSLGIGASLDAPQYGDAGADTFGHIYDTCLAGLADVPGLRQGPLLIPHLASLGLYHASLASTGVIRGEALSPLKKPCGYYGYAVEQSEGKDTPSGHWELMGVPVTTPWGYFTEENPCFPEALIAAFLAQSGLPGILGNKHASGTDIIEAYGALHIQSGQPIVYTSADSVFQIAAHEAYFGLEKLYALCELARTLVDPYRIGRVIARPFVGEPGSFKRTGNRRDYAMPPPAPTLLDIGQAAGREIIAIGKTADIFAHQGPTQTIKATGNDALFEATLQALNTAPAGSLIFTNFVDFDSSYGHRRDIPGYAAALESFDAKLPRLFALLQPNDVILVTADHGCDPTFPGSDHTREHVPILVFGPSITPHFIGRRDTFADAGQTLARYLGLPVLPHGIAFNEPSTS